jgi:hypothetical protein
VRHQKHPERQDESLQQHAAELAFPDWQPGPRDWTSLYTGHDDQGSRYTEVAVYRGTERIHYRRYTGTEVMTFWERLVHEHAE